MLVESLCTIYWEEKEGEEKNPYRKPGSEEGSNRSDEPQQEHSLGVGLVKAICDCVCFFPSCHGVFAFVFSA